METLFHLIGSTEYFSPTADAERIRSSMPWAEPAEFLHTPHGFVKASLLLVFLALEIVE